MSRPLPLPTAAVPKTAQRKRRVALRRFIVETIVDAIVLLAIIAILHIPTVPQPFPFGTEPAHILDLTDAGLVAFLIAAAIWS